MGADTAKESYFTTKYVISRKHKYTWSLSHSHLLLECTERHATIHRTPCKYTQNAMQIYTERRANISNLLIFPDNKTSNSISTKQFNYSEITNTTNSMLSLLLEIHQS